MKILILTEGGGDIGYGHISRCTSIYQAFEEKGIIPEFIVHGEKHIESLLKGKRCRFLDWINDRGQLFEVLNDCDIAFVDSYLAGHEIYEIISSQVETAVYFDDDLRIDYPKGIVVNGALSAEELNYPEKEGIAYLLGISYFPIRKEFSNVLEKEIRREVETLMVTCGGSDMYNVTPVIQAMLNETYPDLHKKIIVTSLFSNIAEIRRLQDDNTELVCDLSAVEFRELMQECDVAISAGGQTLYELASMGVPTIAICVAENQLPSVSGWNKSGVMEYAGIYNDTVFLSKLGIALNKMMSYGKRTYCSRGTRQLVDGNGSTRVAKEVLSCFFKSHLAVRKATKEDAEEVFKLANDNIVRQNSFEQEQIGWDQHLKWFSDNLGDNNRWLFVVESQGQFAGQVRFDREQVDNKIVISISLGQGFCGLNLSETVIEKAIAKITDCCSDIDTIMAYIKVENIPSVKAFKKAGFVFFENAVIKGCEAKVYTRVIRAV